MRSFTFGIEKRSFDVNAENARNALRASLAHRFGGLPQNAWRIGDDRRQQPNGTEIAMRRGNGAHRLHRRRIVEKCATTTIDLHIDEAWRQNAAAEILGSHGTDRLARHHLGDARATDDHGVVIEKILTREHPGADECQCHHIVSVTFCNSRGRSGSRPFARASSSMAR